MAERRAFRDIAKAAAKKSVVLLKKLSPDKAVSKLNKARLNRKFKNVLTRRPFYHKTKLKEVFDSNFEFIDLKRLKSLVIAGADVDARGENGMTGLMISVMKGSDDDILFFLKRGADINAKDSYGATALINAAIYRKPNLKNLRIMLENGADPDIKDKSGNSVFGYLTGDTDIWGAKTREAMIRYLELWHILSKDSRLSFFAYFDECKKQ